MMLPTANVLMFEPAILQWRRDSIAWTMSIMLHVPLLLWKGVPYLMPQNAQMPLSPVQISLTEEETINVPIPAEEAAGAAEGRRGARSVLSRIKSVFKKRDPWEDFEATGPWEKAQPGARNFVPGSGGGSVKGGGPAGGNLSVSGSDLSQVAENWNSTGSKGTRVPIRLAKKTSLDDSEFGGGISNSPWKGKPGGGGGGGQLRGSGEGDMMNKMASGWATSGAGAKESQGEGEASGGGLSGTSRGGGGGNFYELRGPLSTRKIVHSLLPPYPDWAREKGFEASVTVYFIVLPDGSLKQPLIIKKGSGDPRIDELVIKTLKGWRFAKLTKIQEEQWGLITFRFRLQG